VETVAVDVVAAQVNAYNARDLDRFLGYYAPDAVIEDGAGQVLMRGRDAMRSLYGQFFAQSPEVHCEIQQRICVGPYVVDEEAITGFHRAGFPSEVHAAAVYRVEGDRIAHVRGAGPEPAHVTVEAVAVDVVAAQVNAYNARDLDRFLGYYAPNAVIEDGAGQVLMRGRDAMRSLYGQFFAQSPELHCEIQQRICVGPYVVDEEAITGFHLAGFPTEMHAAAVYRLEGDHIAHVRLLM
jgi:uncharacterized protein (TIGR02246 family)